jgi:hypothetical protein
MFIDNLVLMVAILDLPGDMSHIGMLNRCLVSLSLRLGVAGTSTTWVSVIWSLFMHPTLMDTTTRSSSISEQEFDVTIPILSQPPFRLEVKYWK